jgi:hypothetical protein
LALFLSHIFYYFQSLFEGVSLDIPLLPIANFVNNIVKILSGEDPLALKKQLQTGKILQGEIINLLPKGKATLSIAGQKVVAELPKLKTQDNSIGVKPEHSFKLKQKIYARVEKIGPEPVLKLVPPTEQKIQEESYTTSISRKNKPEILKYEKFNELKLSPDKVLQVKVNHVADTNSLSVNFEGQEFLVKAENAKLYRPDTSVRIQFEKTDIGFKPTFIDPLVKPDTVDLELVKSYLPSRTPLGKLVGELTRDILGSPVLKELKVSPQLLEKLRETLKVLTPKPGITPDEVEIKEQMEKSGVRYEAKLKQFLTQTEKSKIGQELTKDLKGQLLELLQVTEKNIKSLPKQNQSQKIFDFQQQVKVSVDSIELNQLSSRISTQENQPLVLQIPNPLSPGDKTINLFIREDSEGEQGGNNEDKNNYNMAFFLNLSALGSVKINANVGPENLAVSMEVEQDDVADFIQNNSVEFEQHMKKKDLNATVECCTRKEVIPIKDNLIELLVSQNTSLLSVKT